MKCIWNRNLISICGCNIIRFNGTNSQPNGKNRVRETHNTNWNANATKLIYFYGHCGNKRTQLFPNWGRAAPKDVRYLCPYIQWFLFCTQAQGDGGILLCLRFCKVRRYLCLSPVCVWVRRRPHSRNVTRYAVRDE